LTDKNKIFKRKKVKSAGILIIAVLTFSVLYFFNNSELQSALIFYPLCLFNTVTGLYCPGCGGLRSFHYFFHGDFWLSLRYNLLLIPVLMLTAYYLFSEFIFLFFSKKLPKFQFPVWLIITIFIVVIFYWIIRNLPGYPFCYLRP